MHSIFVRGVTPLTRQVPLGGRPRQGGAPSGGVPESLKGRRYYDPGDQGYEQEVAERLRQWWGSDPRKGGVGILANPTETILGADSLTGQVAVDIATKFNEAVKEALSNRPDYLAKKKELENNNINSRIVIEKWKEHLSGKRNWQYQLWPILIYQSWKKSLNIS